MEEVEGFRYRCRDAMRSVTKQAIKEARLKEIKEELLNSEKLKTFFEDNPRDFQLLRHDKPIHPARVKPHLKNVPDYLIPKTLRSVARTLIGGKKRTRTVQHRNIKGRRKMNPLKGFKYTTKSSQSTDQTGGK